MLVKARIATTAIVSQYLVTVTVLRTDALTLTKSSSFPLSMCEGHCYIDDDCQGSLMCYHRYYKDPVPGCEGDGDKGKHYCSERPSETYLFEKGNDWSPTVAYPLGLCEGDCDTDSDCDQGLICYQRNGLTEIPGCQGSGTTDSDYCIPEQTLSPSAEPSTLSSYPPSHDSSVFPTLAASESPSRSPSRFPTSNPSTSSSSRPSNLPSNAPSLHVSNQPSISPSQNPSVNPSSKSGPTSSMPSSEPTFNPTLGSSSAYPSSDTSTIPSSTPSHLPTIKMSAIPSILPSLSPSFKPTNQSSSSHSSSGISIIPSLTPSDSPIIKKSLIPSALPSLSPSIVDGPSYYPNLIPSSIPTNKPSWQPSRSLSSWPSSLSSSQSNVPSEFHSFHPSFTSSESMTDFAPIFSFEHDLGSHATSEPDNIHSTPAPTLPTFNPSSAPTTRPSFLRIEVAPSLTANPTSSNSPSQSPSNGPTLAMFIDGLVPAASSGRRNGTNANVFLASEVFLSFVLFIIWTI